MSTKTEESAEVIPNIDEAIRPKFMERGLAMACKPSFSGGVSIVASGC
jgi:hypothetical protein